jgi:hypothetical protein
MCRLFSASAMTHPPSDQPARDPHAGTAGLEPGRIWWSELPTLFGCSASTLVRRLRPSLSAEPHGAPASERDAIRAENERRREHRRLIAKRLDLRRRRTNHPLTPYRFHVDEAAARALAREWRGNQGGDDPVED